ncbi:MAG: hypothetical protein WA364_00880 [Candidatus Nitrosopolaris sp.]|jgi:hypothetical protein
MISRHDIGFCSLLGLIKRKDINAPMNLFADDAIVYEPFSKID